jgi:hypothetical protein
MNMKATKRIIAILLLSFSYSYSYSQVDIGTPSERLTEHKKIINNTPYIFEGTETTQRCYYVRHIGGEIQTCNIIQVTKIFKGSPQLKLGSIKVITYGGHIGNTPYAEPSDGGGIPPIGKGGVYIIFGESTTFEPADSKMVDSMTTDNTLIVSHFDHIVLYNDNTAKWDYTKYDSIDSLYSFLKEGGLTVQEEVEGK